MQFLPEELQGSECDEERDLYKVQEWLRDQVMTSWARDALCGGDAVRAEILTG